MKTKKNFLIKFTIVIVVSFYIGFEIQKERRVSQNSTFINVTIKMQISWVPLGKLTRNLAHFILLAPSAPLVLAERIS